MIALLPGEGTIADVVAGAARWCVVTGDCRDVLATLPAGAVDAVVTDPPYLTTDLAFDLAGLDPAWIEAAERVTQANGYLACFGPIELRNYPVDKPGRPCYNGAIPGG